MENDKNRDHGQNDRDPQEQNSQDYNSPQRNPDDKSNPNYYQSDTDGGPEDGRDQNISPDSNSYNPENDNTNSNDEKRYVGSENDRNSDSDASNPSDYGTGSGHKNDNEGRSVSDIRTTDSDDYNSAGRKRDTDETDKTEDSSVDVAP